MNYPKPQNDAFFANLLTAQFKNDFPNQQPSLNNFFTSFNNILQGAAIHHRKLHRTQSEPTTQVPHASRYKTELCRPYEEAGECKYGDKCQFAHGIQELRVLQRHSKYKTELCRTFHSVGFCPYGTRCHFIHSSQESLADNNNNNNNAKRQFQRELSVPAPMLSYVPVFPSSAPSNSSLIDLLTLMAPKPEFFP